MAIKSIPAKTLHTLFCTVYVLDSRAKSAEGPDPLKWGPKSCIVVYLWHSPFHAGSVSLVFNPSTGRVSPKFHVVFDNYFTAVPYMNTGTTTPNWADLVFHLSELSTYEYFELAQNWSSDLPPMVPESN